MQATNAMKRLSDGELMPYSASLVAARPGEFVEMVYDAKTRKWTKKDGVPLVARPKPAEPAATIPDDMDEEPPKAEYHDPEPETLDGPSDAPVETGKPKKGRK